MRFTKRDMEMIGYLKDYDEVDLSAMSEFLEVSVKTLRNQLKSLAEAMEEYGVSIQFLSGSRVRIQGHEKFIDVMNMSIPRFEMEFERRFLLLLTLHDDFLIIQDIADQLLVSKSYAEKQLSAIMKKYPDDIQSQRHYGIRYAGSQDKRRALFVRILFPYLFGEDYEAALRQFHELHFPILDYFTEDQMGRAKEALRLFRQMQWFRFTDESMQQLFLYVLFLARQRDSGNPEKPGKVDERFLEDFDFEGLEEWLRQLCMQLRLPDTMEEIRYLYFLLLSLRKQKIVAQEQILEKMYCPVREILQGIYERLRVDLSQDEDLIEGLSGHIYTSVLRGDRLEVESDFYMVTSMKRQYPFGFEMAAIAADYISDMYNLTMKDDDLIYLAIHFQAAIERIKDREEKTRIVIICHFGAAAARLIRSKIERKIPDARVVGMYSLQEFMQIPEPDCDCIVTTERLVSCDLPVVYVSMALPEREMKKISECIREIQVTRLLKMNILEAIIVPVEDETAAGAIETMVCPLTEEEYVEEGYLSTVLEREKISSTSMCYIAMPHGNPAMVESTRLVIGRMKNPVNWDGAKVYCAFLFAVSADVLKNQPMAFNTFYRVLANPDVEEKIRRLQADNDLPDEVFRQRLFQIFQILR